ncbi:MAG: hypothetical protein ACREYF_27160 [Gammaproteobacteria bacterium]
MSRSSGAMVIDMIEAKLARLEQIKTFLKGREATEYSECGEGGELLLPYR